MTLLASPSVRYATAPDGEPVLLAELAAALAAVLVEAREAEQQVGGAEVERNEGTEEVSP